MNMFLAVRGFVFTLFGRSFMSVLSIYCGYLFDDCFSGLTFGKKHPFRTVIPDFW